MLISLSHTFLEVVLVFTVLRVSQMILVANNPQSLPSLYLSFLLGS